MSALWTAVAAHLWQATLVLAMIAVLAAMLRRAPARYLEGLWTIGLLKLLAPLPLLATLWPAIERLVFAAGPREPAGPAVRTLSQIAYPDMLWIEPAAGAERGSPAELWIVATIIWGVGAAALLIKWWRRGRVPIPDDVAAPWDDPDDDVERLIRIARSVQVPLSTVRVTDAAVVPCVRGFRRPVVVLSRAVIRSLRDDELRAVLLHEDAHRRRGDLWRAILEGLATRVFFFYPPAWWLARRLRASAEMACDEAVLAAGIDARTYARALARTVVLELRPSPTPALSSGRSHLHTRLQRIREPERYTAMRRHRVAILVAVALAVVISFVPVADGVGFPYASAVLPTELPEAVQGRGEWLPAADLRGLNGLDMVVGWPDRSLRAPEVLAELGRRGGFEVYLMSNEEVATRITIDATAGVRVREVLGILGERAGLEYRVVDRSTLIARLRPAVRAQRALEELEDSLQREVAKKVVKRSPEGASTESGNMRVRALDSDGAPLPGVMVLARGAGSSRTQYTGVDGTARFPGLLPGSYTVTFSRDGFEKVFREGLEIRPQRTTAFDLTLQRRDPVSAALQTPERGPYRVGGDIQEPERIHYVAPEYPELARQARMEGFVILQAVIDRQGNVKDAEVLRGLGLGLDVAARDAVLQWKYTPTYYNGTAVEVILTINVVFQLIE